MSEMLDMLQANPNIILSDTITEEQETYDEPPYRIRGCVLTSMERLDDEFIKLLKECDPHSNEYVERYVYACIFYSSFTRFFNILQNAMHHLL